MKLFQRGFLAFAPSATAIVAMSSVSALAGDRVLQPMDKACEKGPVEICL